MSKKLKRMICFIATFALAFIAVKPMEINAAVYTPVSISSNQSGEIHISDPNGVSLDNPLAMRSYIYKCWDYDDTLPEGHSVYWRYAISDGSGGFYDELSSGASLGTLNWASALAEENAEEGVYTIYLSLVEADEYGDYDGPLWSDDYGHEVTYAPSLTTGTYLAVFDYDDGTTVKKQEVSVGKKPTAPTDPTKENYDFSGWKFVSLVNPLYPSETITEGPNFDKFEDEDWMYMSNGCVVSFKAQWTAKAADPAPDEQKVYNILEGGDQTITQGSGNDLVVRADGEFIACTGIFVDGEAFEDSTITAGSTIVTIKAAVLDKMAVGTHKLTFAFKDGVATTTFTLKAAEKTTEVTTEASTAAPATVTTTEAAKTTTTNTASPKTGDEGIMIYGILMLLSLAGMVGMSLKKKDN